MHRIDVGARDLVLVAGLPGAGKSTLLAALGADARVTVRDSDQVRDRLRRALPRVPYRAYRPAVHVAHRLRVLAAVLGARGPVLVHDPATRAGTRALFAAAAALAGRPAVLVWLDVAPADALAGQHRRGRTVPAGSFARHVARAEALRARWAAGEVPRGWRRVEVVRRDERALLGVSC